MSDPTPVSEVLKKIIGEMSEGKKSFESQLLDDWEELVGKDISKHARPKKVSGTMLFVAVDNPTWLYEMKVNYIPRILKKIKDRYGSDKIKKIRLDIGSIED